MNYKLISGVAVLGAGLLLSSCSVIRTIAGLDREAAPVESTAVLSEVEANAGGSLPEAEPVAGEGVYQPREEVRGRLRSQGSDTMDRLMADWESVFRSFHPEIVVIHEGKGSSTAIPGLLEGSTNFGPMSRTVRPEEVDRFAARFGYPPMLVPVAVDALAVYVHPDNPVLSRGLSLPELDAIFSATRSLGYPENIRTWGDLGLGGEYARAPINLYSRNQASGTRAFFAESALGGGSFKPTIRELPGSAQIVEAVANDPFGIGYSGFGYRTDRVGVVGLAPGFGAPVVAASEATAFSGEYPLARFLFLSVNRDPVRELPPLQAEFFRFLFSDEGKAAVRRNGFFPLSPADTARQLDLLGL